MERLLIFFMAGAVAQVIDGSLGMGFGVIGTSVLVAGGASAAAASAAIHGAKIGTSLLSGTAHSRFGNVHWRTVWLMGLPGMVGGFVGAWALSNFEGEHIAPITAMILLVLGGLMLARFAFGTTPAAVDPGGIGRNVLMPLGLVGGVIDAVGGGGWGPLATPVLIGPAKMEPRLAVGSVSASEFFVAVGATVGFVGNLDTAAINWDAFGALLLGAACAAPVAAWTVRVLPFRVLGTVVGALIVILNIRTIMVATNASPLLLGLVMLLSVAFGVLLVIRSWLLHKEEQDLIDEARLREDVARLREDENSGIG